MSKTFHLQFQLDTNDNGYHTGKAMFVLYERQNGDAATEQVANVSTHAIHLCGKCLDIWEDQHGTINIHQTDAHELSPAEWVELTLENDWAGICAEREAEEMERKREADLKMATKVYNMMMSSSFETWYPGEFMDHVEGEEDALDKDAILEKIIKMI